jgi:chemotaxis protein CheX
MTLSLPTVITGKKHVISFGSATQIIRIPYACQWGEMVVEVGLVEHERTSIEPHMLDAAELQPA